jgi:hypothetical protein
MPIYSFDLPERLGKLGLKVRCPPSTSTAPFWKMLFHLSEINARLQLANLAT